MNTNITIEQEICGGNWLGQPRNPDINQRYQNDGAHCYS
jgi:hypothetical protein